MNLEDPRSLVEVLGDETDAIVEPTEDKPVCEVCGADNPARTKNTQGTLMCTFCLDDSYEDDDVARMVWEDQSYDAWAAEHAEDLAEGAYLDWAMIREQDGEDNSREAYEAHIDALVAASEPD